MSRETHFVTRARWKCAYSPFFVPRAARAAAHVRCAVRVRGCGVHIVVVSFMSVRAALNSLSLHFRIVLRTAHALTWRVWIHASHTLKLTLAVDARAAWFRYKACFFTGLRLRMRRSV